MHNKTVLDNGLTVITEHIPEFRSCTLGVWAGTGSRYETEIDGGISHLLEHMMFKGTAKRSAYDIAVAMDAVGGQMNAFTEKEFTCYYARVMDLHVPLAVEVLADMMVGSLIDAEELEREKGVILEEIKMYEDTPDDQIFDLFTRAFYKGHVLGRPIIGSAEVVSAISQAQVKDYIQRRYRAGNITVAAAGQIEHDKFVELVQQHLGQLLPTGETERALQPPTPVHHLSVFNKDCEQAYVCLGAPGLAYADPRRYGLLLLDSVLGGSMSSRLFQEIREKRGLVYSVSTFQNTYADTGMLGIFAGTSAERVPTVLEVTRDILTDVHQNGITREEMERAREYMKGSIALSLESTTNRMMRLARNHLYHGKFIPLEELIARIDAVTLEDLSALARDVVDPAKFSMAVLGPLEEVDGVVAQPIPASSPAALAARR
jgi:predicted Zn-dependent peptidase